MRILILDDMKIRHNAFQIIYPNDQITSALKFSDFVFQLENNSPWDLIHLDHDLGDEVADADTYVDGWGATREFNGAHASMRICQLPIDRHPGQVIVHSINSTGAKIMVENLSRAGIDVRWEPFGDVTVSR